jgi:hypothetical protein
MNEFESYQVDPVEEDRFDGNRALTIGALGGLAVSTFGPYFNGSFAEHSPEMMVFAGATVTYLGHKADLIGARLADKVIERFNSKCL